VMSVLLAGCGQVEWNNPVSVCEPEINRIKERFGRDFDGYMPDGTPYMQTESCIVLYASVLRADNTCHIAVSTLCSH
jgi:hypothetical protein